MGGYNGIRFLYILHVIKVILFVEWSGEKKTVAELDGPIHKYTRYYDYQRDLVLKKCSLRSLRLSNGELRNVVTVKKKILNLLEQQQY